MLESAHWPPSWGHRQAVRPLMVIAVATLGDHTDVAPEIAERDGRKRARLPLDQVVLNGPVRVR
jgi:hypothetical protein